jgi:hypothetical protein
MEKMASAARGKLPPAPALDPEDDLPQEYWQSILDDARADARSQGPSSSAQRLSEIARHLLRVSCRRCGRTVEIQKADAIRLYGSRAFWKEVGLRLLDDTCTQRTGRHEEDGCWPSY